MAGAPPICLPAAQVGAGLLEHPTAQWNDQAGFLGEGNELHRRHEAFIGVFPTHEGFHAHNVAVGESHHGLIVQDELATVDGPLERGPTVEAGQDHAMEARLEELVGALAAILGRVER
jgi:hypothetical protein